LQKPIPIDYKSDSSKHVLKSKASKAPWEVWSLGNYNNKDYLAAQRYEEEGNLDSASESLSKALNGAKTSEEAESYLLLLSSIDLKSGSSEKALSRISKYASKRHIDAGQLDSRFSLLTSYCYIAKNNTDQAYAWLVQSFKSGHGVGKIAEDSRRIAREYVRTFSAVELNDLQANWEKDSFVSSIIREEKSRRLQGGSIYSKSFLAKYFTRSNYELSPSQYYDSQVEEVIPPVDTTETSPISNNSSKIKIGALLPISGQYASHAKKVEEGIRLALREAGLESSLIVYDSNVDLIKSYNRLANEDKVKIVFGPMLVKDVETLATLQNNLSVPLVTYAKKRGLPALSPQIFRLGGTPENQLQTLLVFAQGKLGARKIALLYPEGEVGAEYNDAFQTIKVRGTDIFLESFHYQSRNLTQLNSLREQLATNSFDTVIIADSLPSAEPVLRAFKDSSISTPPNILGVSLLLDSEKISSYQAITEGVYLVSLFNSASKQAENIKFIEDYRNAFGQNPDLLAAQSYDSVKFALSAISNPSSRLDENLLNSSALPGVTGTMHVLSDGDINRDLSILKVINGSLFEVTQ